MFENFIKKTILSLVGIGVVAATPNFAPDLLANYYIDSQEAFFSVPEDVAAKMNLTDDQKKQIDVVKNVHKQNFDKIKDYYEPQFKDLFDITKNTNPELIKGNMEKGTSIASEAVNMISEEANSYSQDLKSILTSEQEEIYSQYLLKKMEEKKKQFNVDKYMQE